MRRTERMDAPHAMGNETSIILYPSNKPIIPSI